MTLERVCHTLIGVPPDPATLTRLARTRTIDLTTIGRRTGNPARIEIWWFAYEERFIITGTPGRRDWYANVLANPRVVIHLSGEDYPATAEVVSDRGLRYRFFTDRTARWYASQAELTALVDTAPMIALELD